MRIFKEDKDDNREKAIKKFYELYYKMKDILINEYDGKVDREQSSSTVSDLPFSMININKDDSRKANLKLLKIMRSELGDLKVIRSSGETFYEGSVYDDYKIVYSMTGGQFYISIK